MHWGAWTAAGLGATMSLLILYQDLKGRWVHLLPLVLLFASGVAYRWIRIGTSFWEEMLLNLGFVALVVLLVVAFFRLKKGGPVINRLLGIGDVLLFLAAAAWLDGPGFALFFCSGMLIVLIGAVGMLALGQMDREYPIPLAGLLAAWLLCFVPLYDNFGGPVRSWFLQGGWMS